jgi:hypothetical protein
MPVFVSNKPMAWVAGTKELRTPWRRWFAWYPVTDMNITYWLCCVEWRHVVADGVATTHPFYIPPRIEYRAV